MLAPEASLRAFFFISFLVAGRLAEPPAMNGYLAMHCIVIKEYCQVVIDTHYCLILPDKRSEVCAVAILQACCFKLLHAML